MIRSTPRTVAESQWLSCPRKKRYLTPEAAAYAAQGARLKGEEVRAYRCGCCGWFHTGHVRERREG